jgi:hypothetical protein
MKLRIHKNTIRLRLSQTEVNQLGQGVEIIEELRFPGPYPPFAYALKIQGEGDEITISHEAPRLFIFLPASKIKVWAGSDQVGITENILLDDGLILRVLIEKDFQCLHQRPNEDEKDNFPNPQA